jgi:deoxyribonuclease V
VSDTRLKHGFSVERAHKTQISLSKHVVFEDKFVDKIRLVGGVDVAYTKDFSIGVATVLDFPSLKLKESKTAICRTLFPYIPTLLSFREIPPSVLAIQKLTTEPSVFLVDGHGYAHPYRCGFASHLGLVIGRPTVGVAKGILVGDLETSKDDSDTVLLIDGNEIIGAQITPKAGRKPVYVSVGHMTSLSTAVKIVRGCTANSYIPEPIALAHNIAASEKRKINISIQT